MKPAYNEIVKRTFFCSGKPIGGSVFSGRPGEDAPYYTHAVIDRRDDTVLYMGYCRDDCERRIRTLHNGMIDEKSIEKLFRAGLISVAAYEKSIRLAKAQRTLEGPVFTIEPLSYWEEMIPWVFRTAGDTTLSPDWNPHMVYFYFMENGVRYFSYARVDAKSARDAYRRCKEWCFKLTGNRALDPSIRIKMTREEYEQYESTGRIRLLTGRGDA